MIKLIDECDMETGIKQFYYVAVMIYSVITYKYGESLVFCYHTASAVPIYLVITVPH